MRILPLATLLLISFFSIVGCTRETASPDASANASATATTNEPGDEPADGNTRVDHGVLGHAHGAGPHGGVIADWGGGKYHVEFTVDHDQQQGTVYILGPDEKSPVPIDAESIELSITDPTMQVTLTATPQQSDPAGMASRFVGNHPKLGLVQEYAGTISGVIDGTPYSGDFDEEPHADHAD